MFIYKLYTKDYAKFHIGKNEINDSFEGIHSDTLFSALVNCYILLYGKDTLKDFINLFIKRHVRISSAFYFIDILENNSFNKTILFFPNPRQIFNRDADQERLLSAKYISFKLFSELISNFRTETMCSKLNSDINFISEDFCTAENEFPGSIKLDFKQNIIEPKAASNFDRVRADKIKTYSETNILLKKLSLNNLTIKPGMFFLADIKPGTLDMQFHIEKLDSSIRLICDEGIGGRRSFGNGQFSHIQKNEFIYESDFFDNAHCKINLSLISPGTDELKFLKDRIIKYSSVIRSGWTPTHSKLKNIRMIAESSIFSNKVTGRFINIAPSKFKDHKIYRNGIGFYL